MNEEITYFIIGIIIGIALGYCGYMVYNSYERNYDGLYFKMNTTNKFTAQKAAIEIENDGHWICVNIKGMSYDDAVKTCRHEASHELFAECGEANNISKCVNDYNNQTK